MTRSSWPTFRWTRKSWRTEIWGRVWWGNPIPVRHAAFVAFFLGKVLVVAPRLGRSQRLLRPLKEEGEVPYNGQTWRMGAPSPHIRRLDDRRMIASANESRNKDPTPSGARVRIRQQLGELADPTSGGPQRTSGPRTQRGRDDRATVRFGTRRPAGDGDVRGCAIRT